MEEKFLRTLIRDTLNEYFQAQPVVYFDAARNNFPYFANGSITMLPNDISAKKNYFQNYQDIASNQDVYKFPFKEFELGLKVEQERHKEFNILNVAEVVIKNLIQDSHFYSKLFS